MNYQDIANQLRKLEPNDGSYCRLVPGEKMDVILSALDLASAAGDMLAALRFFSKWPDSSSALSMARAAIQKATTE